MTLIARIASRCWKRWSVRAGGTRCPQRVGDRRAPARRSIVL